MQKLFILINVLFQPKIRSSVQYKNTLNFYIKSLLNFKWQSTFLTNGQNILILCYD